MTKRPPASDPQFGFAFGEPEAFSRDGALQGLGRRTAVLVGEMLKGDSRSRYEVAADVSRLLDEEVSKAMLDAYASPARDAHRISFDRMLALVVSCSRYDLLRQVLHAIGADLVVGEEVLTLHLGHLKARQKELAEQVRRAEAVAEPLMRHGRTP